MASYKPEIEVTRRIIATDDEVITIVALRPPASKLSRVSPDHLGIMTAHLSWCARVTIIVIVLFLCNPHIHSIETAEVITITTTLGNVLAVWPA
ncbi:hypothetical protein AKJ16_DCAP20147 [Drosera capensis]